jgi:hypothetical protein
VINKGLYALLFLLAACSGDSALSPCDIRDSTCRLDVFLAVQDVRGSLWDPWIEPPPMDVISEAEYRAQVIAERERARQQTGIDYFTEALKLLRMIDPAETPSDRLYGRECRGVLRRERAPRHDHRSW